MSTETKTASDFVTECMAKHGITVSSEFVPFSKSRFAQPDKDGKAWRSLNWKVTLHREGRAILTTDYSAGEAHCPAYTASLARMGNRNSLYRRNAIEWECENGFKAALLPGGGIVTADRKRLEPNAADVVVSLLRDSDVLDYGSFEEWAGAYGYDSDSRKAESTYRACLDIALKLRNGLGDAVIAELQEAAADY